MTKLIVSLALIGSFAAPSFAQQSYYVVRGEDKKCKIVETRPTDTKIVVLNDKAYVTRDEADRQIKVVCKE